MALSIMTECCYAECHLQALYAECRYAECRYAECRYAECRYAECRGAFLQLKITLVKRLRQWKGPKLKTIYNRNLH
jgi:hypothetical protein